MKQKLLKLMCLLCVGVISASAWADSVTFDATEDVSETESSYQTSVKTYTASDGSEWKATGYGSTAGVCIVIGKGGANYLETPQVSGDITSVEVTWSGNANYYLALQTTIGTELSALQNPSSSQTQTFTVTGSYRQLRLVGRRNSGTSNAAATITKVVVNYSTSSEASTTTTISDAGITNTDVYASTAAGSLAASVTDAGSPVTGATVTWSGNNDAVATINANTGAVTLVAAGTVTFTATYAGETGTYAASSATYEMTVVDNTPDPYMWVETSLSALTASDIFVIVGDNGGTYAMTNDNGTTSAPAAVSVTISDNKISSAVAANMKWNISGNATDGYTFYPNGNDEKWLYCNTTAASSSNNNMRVGTGTRNAFVLSENYLKTKDSNTDRYVSVYPDGPDWRGYINTTTQNTTFKFYKAVDATYTRTVSAGNWGTICLPYAATVTGATLYSITDKDASGITVTESGTTATAGVPYIFKATATQLVATYTGATYTAAGTANGLHGTYSDIDFADVVGYNDGDYYVVLPSKVQAASSKSGVDAYRAYIVLGEITSSPGVKGIRLGFDEATAITELTEKTEATEGVIYNLQGQRVNSLQRGINIVGGKKVLVK